MGEHTLSGRAPEHYTLIPVLTLPLEAILGAKAATALRTSAWLSLHRQRL